MTWIERIGDLVRPLPTRHKRARNDAKQWEWCFNRQFLVIQPDQPSNASSMPHPCFDPLLWADICCLRGFASIGEDGFIQKLRTCRRYIHVRLQCGEAFEDG